MNIHLHDHCAAALGRSYACLSGRGTTAFWLALRAIERRTGPGEVIIPDLLCSTALEGLLLAGFMPIFADIDPARFTITPESVTRLLTPQTRAVVVVHLFGHCADIDAIRQAAPGIPIIEDAVQGLGGTYHGKPIGAAGDISFVSFDPYKMIGGRGGALLWDDPALTAGIMADAARLPDLPDSSLSALGNLLPPPAAAAYAEQLRTFSAPALLRPFDPSPANVAQIAMGWQTLTSRVEERNAKAHWLHKNLAALPLTLPDLRPGDAIWRYTITAPSVIVAQQIKRRMQSAGLNGSALYYPLSQLFEQRTNAAPLTNRLINLWVDESITDEILQRTVEVIAAVPYPH